MMNHTKTAWFNTIKSHSFRGSSHFCSKDSGLDYWSNAFPGHDSNQQKCTGLRLLPGGPIFRKAFLEIPTPQQTFEKNSTSDKRNLIISVRRSESRTRAGEGSHLDGQVAVLAGRGQLLDVPVHLRHRQAAALLPAADRVLQPRQHPLQLRVQVTAVICKRVWTWVERGHRHERSLFWLWRRTRLGTTDGSAAGRQGLPPRSLTSQAPDLLRPGANAEALLGSFRPWPFSRQPCHAAFSHFSLKGSDISNFSGRNKEMSQGLWDFWPTFLLSHSDKDWFQKEFLAKKTWKLLNNKANPRESRDTRHFVAAVVFKNRNCIRNSLCPQSAYNQDFFLLTDVTSQQAFTIAIYTTFFHQRKNKLL